MDKSAFLLTGTGRSGTTFLAETLSRSRKWEVNHESPNDHRYLDALDDRSANELKDRFRKIYYGEVNSQLRRIAPALKRRGIRVYFTVRHPKDIIRSVHTARGRSRDQFLVTLYELLPAFTDIFLLKLLGVQCFKFEKFTTEKEYLYEMMKGLGVDDVDMGEVSLNRKVNSNGTGTMEKWDLTKEERYSFLDKCGWFMRVFGYHE